MCKGKALDAMTRRHSSDAVRLFRRRRGRARDCRAGGTPGFTLVELLIVIAIIGILATLALKAISAVQSSTDSAITTTEINSLGSALEQYNQDEGQYPGQGKKVGRDENQFPLLFNALFGERTPKGPGGRNAPYMQLKEDKIVVYDEDTEEYRTARRREIYDPKIDKFMLDAWGNPLIYRCNKGRQFEDYMHNRYNFDLYSIGPDGVDQTAEGYDEDNDDVGNW